MSKPAPVQWLDWHIDSRIIDASSRGATLRLIEDDVVRGEVPVTAGEMANLERRFREKLQAQEAVRASENDASA